MRKPHRKSQDYGHRVFIRLGWMETRWALNMSSKEPTYCNGQSGYLCPKAVLRQVANECFKLYALFVLSVLSYSSFSVFNSLIFIMLLVRNLFWSHEEFLLLNVGMFKRNLIPRSSLKLEFLWSDLNSQPFENRSLGLIIRIFVDHLRAFGVKGRKSFVYVHSGVHCKWDFDSCCKLFSFRLIRANFLY